MKSFPWGRVRAGEGSGNEEQGRAGAVEVEAAQEVCEGHLQETTLLGT